ncbi:PREDICTED: uncharacterized protein LOC108557321 [Nicrophorus vespilloides]|uniref:Uncharacterized protein LOC108557321 n=1 Tax=Nicrophorus vespilloides TaxID=110193 RepID=A0ABM1M3Y0_NICVS|nr:PREDICTED: uncharacterized protein LOC108557321 [Nicrophorus vespilloides]
MSTCMPGSSLRFLGPSVKIAIPLSILWGTACSFLAALIVQSTRTLSARRILDDQKEDLTVLASIELCLALITLSIVVVLMRIDCRYDPD